MKRLLCAIAALGLGAPVLAADVGVSVQVGQPGFYGRIDVGNCPAPQLLYAEPIVIQPVPVGIVRQPIYLRVPPGHAKNWRKHCHRYNACGQPVYFVQDTWYNDVYVPRYRGSHYAAGAPVPLVAPAYGYRPQPQERVYVVPVSSVRAVVGAPEQRCWVERQQVVEDRSDVNVPGAIAGAVIGGVLGHQVGGGRGKDIATAGGAVAGAAIGANVGRGGSQVYSQDVQRCAQCRAPSAPRVLGRLVQLPRRAASRAIERASRPDDYRECIRGTERVAASRSLAAGDWFSPAPAKTSGLSGPLFLASTRRAVPSRGSRQTRWIGQHLHSSRDPCARPSLPVCAARRTTRSRRPPATGTVRTTAGTSST